MALGYDQAGDVVLNRVLIIPASYPPVLGGVQTVSHRLACHLAERGSNVAVLTKRYPRGLAKHETIDGIEISRGYFFPSAIETLRVRRPDLAVASVLTRLSDRRLTSRLLELHHPEIVNIHFPNWQVALLPMIRAEGARRLVVSLHGDEVMRAARGEPGQRRRLIKALEQADCVTACSGWLMEQACQLEPGAVEKSKVAWNGIDSERYESVMPMERERPYVLGFGRMVAKKGFDLLIEAFAGLKLEKRLDLALVGSGPESDRLKRLAADCGIADRVVFAGRVFSDDMLRWVRGARLAVVPSREEPFGMAALEAAAAGVPLVATRVGGIPEFLDGVAEQSGSVLLCKPDRQDLQAAMTRVLRNTESNSIDHDRADRIRDIFAWKNRMKTFEDALTLSGSPTDG